MKIERLIAKRFDELADTFPLHIEERDSRLMAIVRQAGTIEAKRVLEIGCGKGRVSRIFKSRGASVYGIDPSERLLKDAKVIREGHFFKAEAYDIPFKNDTFDIIVLLEVIEHIPSLPRALKEIIRVLKRDGRLIIVDRNKFSLNNRRFLVPNLLMKRYHELKNEWMYPRDFPYRERWFNPRKVYELFRENFNNAGYEHVLSDGEDKRWWHAVFKLIPQARHFVLWYGISKKPAGPCCIGQDEGIRAVVKEFGPADMRVREKVAAISSAESSSTAGKRLSNIFTLRIDADEYTKESFSAYYGVFERYKDAITIFFCADSFKDAKGEIKRCKETGLDVQSHGFYHYTYGDYESNRYNIHKAKIFFEEIGIDTNGFASPMGRWNGQLMRALEDEGYEYSSDFSYDYLSTPSYPCLNGRRAKVLEIPVFPVCPELFFMERQPADKIFSYYRNAIDEISESGLPVIIYAHTNPGYTQVPFLLERVAEYGLSQKKLIPKNMTDIFKCFKESPTAEGKKTASRLKTPGDDYLGRRISLPMAKQIKDCIKERIDFERITPEDELRCGLAKKSIKLIARKLLRAEEKDGILL